MSSPTTSQSIILAPCPPTNKPNLETETGELLQYSNSQQILLEQPVANSDSALQPNKSAFNSPTKASLDFTVSQFRFIVEHDVPPLDATESCDADENERHKADGINLDNDQIISNTQLQVLLKDDLLMDSQALTRENDRLGSAPYIEDDAVDTNPVSASVVTLDDDSGVGGAIMAYHDTLQCSQTSHSNGNYNTTAVPRDTSLQHDSLSQSVKSFQPANILPGSENANEKAHEFHIRNSTIIEDNHRKCIKRDELQLVKTSTNISSLESPIYQNISIGSSEVLDVELWTALNEADNFAHAERSTELMGKVCTKHAGVKMHMAMADVNSNADSSKEQMTPINLKSPKEIDHQPIESAVKSTESQAHNQSTSITFQTSATISRTKTPDMKNLRRGKKNRRHSINAFVLLHSGSSRSKLKFRRERRILNSTSNASGDDTSIWSKTPDMKALDSPRGEKRRRRESNIVNTSTPSKKASTKNGGRIDTVDLPIECSGDEDEGTFSDFQLDPGVENDSIKLNKPRSLVDMNSIEDIIPDQELMSYIVSGEMDISVDELSSQHVLPSSSPKLSSLTHRNSDHVLPPPDFTPSFRTARNKPITISKTSREFGQKVAESLVSNDPESHVPHQSTTFTKAGRAWEPVAKNLADLKNASLNSQLRRESKLPLFANNQKLGSSHINSRLFDFLTPAKSETLADLKDFKTPAFSSRSNPPTSSFTTGRGKSIAPISVEAFQIGQKLLNSINEDSNFLKDDERIVKHDFGAASNDSSLNSNMPQYIQKPFTASVLLGFSTGRDRSLAPASKSANEFSKEHKDGVDKETKCSKDLESNTFASETINDRSNTASPGAKSHERTPDENMSPLSFLLSTPKTSASLPFGFSTGSGRRLAPVSKKAIAFSKQFMDEVAKEYVHLNDAESNSNICQTPVKLSSGTGTVRTLESNKYSAEILLPQPIPKLFASSAISGFSIAKGQNLIPVSTKAIEFSKQIMDEVTEEFGDSKLKNIHKTPLKLNSLPNTEIGTSPYNGDMDKSETSSIQKSSFISATGKSFDPLTATQLAAAKKILASEELVDNINQPNPRMTEKLAGISKFAVNFQKMNPLTQFPMTPLAVLKTHTRPFVTPAARDFSKTAQMSLPGKNVVSILGSSAIATVPRSFSKSGFPPSSTPTGPGAKLGTSVRLPKFSKQRGFVPPKQIHAASPQVPLAEKVQKTPAVSRSCEKISKMSLREKFQGSRQIYSYEELAHDQNIPPEVLDMTSRSAPNFTFLSAHGSGEWGSSEAHTELLARVGHSGIITEAWVLNHYRWIVWKMAGMIRSFPELRNQYFTKEYILNQLSYRFQKENNAKRSCLKLIIEGDAQADATIVLCVSTIFVEGLPVNQGCNISDAQDILLELTDGWYSLKANIDLVLLKAVQGKQIFEGMKLLIYGAQILGTTGSNAALDVADSLRLRINGNGTRRACWDAKLGFQNPSRPFQVALKRISPDGGPVPLVDVIIERVYPMLFVEKLEDGRNVIRNEVEEDEEVRKHNGLFQDECQKIIDDLEKIGDNVENEFDVREQALEVVPVRNISRLIKFRICDCPPDGETIANSASTLLTIWNPDPGLLEYFREGRRIKILGLIPDKKRMAGSIPELKMGGKKRFFPMDQRKERLTRTIFNERKFIHIKDLQDISEGVEFDLIAAIVSVTEVAVWLTDSSLKMLQINAYHKPFLKFKTGDVICLKNIKFLFRTGGYFYARLEKDTSIITQPSNPIEKDIKAAMLQFCKSHDFDVLSQEFADIQKISQATRVTATRFEIIQFLDIVASVSDSEVNDSSKILSVIYSETNEPTLIFSASNGIDIKSIHVNWKLFSGWICASNSINQSDLKSLVIMFLNSLRNFISLEHGPLESNLPELMFVLFRVEVLDWRSYLSDSENAERSRELESLWTQICCLLWRIIADASVDIFSDM